MDNFSAENFFPNATSHLTDRVTSLVALHERIFKELDAFFEKIMEHQSTWTRTFCLREWQ
jgi:hypothetical protein